jgi:hypothetical protein
MIGSHKILLLKLMLTQSSNQSFERDLFARWMTIRDNDCIITSVRFRPLYLRVNKLENGLKCLVKATMKIYKYFILSALDNLQVRLDNLQVRSFNIKQNPVCKLTTASSLVSVFGHCIYALIIRKRT